jgi:tripartite ATP-independent transporter DctM subunit
MNGFFWIPILILVVTFVFRIPIALGMVSAGVFYLVARGFDIGIVTDAMMNTMYGNTVILAVPMFIFTANVLNSSKVTEYMFQFCKGLAGNRKGAQGYVNVINSFIFAGMSGSAIADASGLGLMEIEEMEKDGYDRPFSCALTAATATIGPIFPPSIPMVIYSMLSGASVGALFLGGVVPGILLASFLCVYVFVVSKKRNYPAGTKYTLREFVRFTLKAFPILLTPVILLYGIYGGVVTATEAGALAALYALIISVLVYRTMDSKGIVKALKDTALQTGRTTIMTAASAVMSYMVATEGVARNLAATVLSMTDDKYLLLFLINLAFLILGMFIDTSTIQYVFVPMVIPIVSALGINLVHFGVMIVLNMMIGLSTPPFGMLLFITSGLSNTPLKDIAREILPMILVMIALLFLMSYIPGIVTALPLMAGAMQ